jgi:WD40 repeat protein/transcriptional regulator with XRE-family HTH domain
VQGFPVLAVRHRGRTGLTQRDLAARVGVHLRSIQDWEAGLSHPSAQRLRALIAVFLDAAAFVEGHELAEAQALWSAAQAEAQRLRSAFDAAWFAGLLARRAGRAAEEPPPPDRAGRAPRRQHWGEAPDVTAFMGRDTERQLLHRWVLDDRSRAVAILGLGGVGKTLLATRLAQDVAPGFEFVYWRSLRNAPTPSEWLNSAIGFLSPDETPAAGAAAQLERLLELVQHSACLLVLDNLETVLEPGQRAGSYRAGFEAYGRLIRDLGESPHRSCLLITSREEPPEVGALKAEQGPVRVLRLSGLDFEVTRALLGDKHLEGDAAAWRELVARHAGNGLALKVVGEAIREFFGGSIAAYLESVTDSQAAMFGSVRQLLDSQIQRLSDAEQSVLLWLAVEREPVTFTELMDGLGGRLGPGPTLEAVEGLRRRSMLERADQRSRFTLQSVVLEYMTEQLVDETFRELTSGPLRRLLDQPLLKATASDYVRGTQQRLITAPLIERLVASCGSRRQAEQRLLTLLDQLRGRPPADQGYGPGNLVNLLCLLRGELQRVDLSHLLIRQAYLQAIDAQDASLASAEVAQSVLAEAFTAPTSVALSADGSFLAAGTAAGEVCMWRAADRALLLSVRGHAGMITCVAIAPDGRQVASGSLDGSVKVWATSSGRLLAELDSAAGTVWGIAPKEDRWLAVKGELDGTVELLQAPEWQLLTKVQHHASPVQSVALSGDACCIASGSQDGTIKVWEAPSGRLLGTLHGHTGPVARVALSCDGQLLASAGVDRTVRLWDARKGQLLGVLDAMVHGLAVSSDGQLVATGSPGAVVRLWEAPAGRLLATLHGHTGDVRDVALSSDARLLASANPEGDVTLWETGSSRQLASLRGSSTAVTYVALSADGLVLASGSLDGAMRLWDTANGQLLATLRGNTGLVYGAALSADGRLVAGGSYGTIRLWDAPSGRLQATLQGHAGLAYQVAMSGDSRLVASGSIDGTIRVWETPSGRLQATLAADTPGAAGQAGDVRGVALNGDGHLLASGGSDGTVRLWDPSKGHLLAALAGHSGTVNSVALTDDGRFVASAGYDGTARVWDATSGQLLAILEGHTAMVNGVAFGHDGQLLASGSDDGTVKLWELPSGNLLRTLRGHTSGIRGVALSRDAGLLASGSLDGTITLWEPNSGSKIRTLRADRRYERMDISGLSGITRAQRAVLVQLGAVDSARTP